MCFFFSSRRRHTRYWRDWSSDVCSSDLFDRLKMMPLNDSKAPFQSRRDRHELIGEGTIGPDPFRRIMTDCRLTAVPKVIETPKGNDAETTDRRMLELLRRSEERRVGKECRSRWSPHL